MRVISWFVSHIKFILRLLRNRAKTLGKSGYLIYGDGLHLGANVRLWAPNHIKIGRCVYIGKNTHIEANVTIGDYCLIANNVAFVGRHDHDFKEIGIPVRFSKWINDYDLDHPYRIEEVDVGDDVWVGYGSIVMTGVKIGRGAIIAAGSVVVKNVNSYEIVAGTPAKVVGKRFTDEEIKVHEYKVDNGLFKYSERGLKYSIIKPAK